MQCNNFHDDTEKDVHANWQKQQQQQQQQQQNKNR